MKKLLASISLLAAVGATAIGMTSCGGYRGPQIEVLVQTADHGWTGAVQKYALEHAEKINKEGKHHVKVTACEDPDAEIKKIDDLLADTTNVQGIVMLPIDSTLETAVTRIADKKVPFVQFDRVITTNDKINNAESRVANVLGDNYGIGKATALEFIAKGIEKTDKILLMPGDKSSVPVSRTTGFKETLMEKKGWTSEEVEAMITSTDYTGWSRTESKKLFTGIKDATKYNFIFTHDSEIALGILEALKTNDVSKEVKDHFKNGGIKSLASSSGLDEMYAVLENKHTADYVGTVLSKDTYLFDVTYDPAMIKIAIDDMIAHLENRTVKKDHVVEVKVVNKDNVTEFQGFGTGKYRK